MKQRLEAIRRAAKKVESAHAESDARRKVAEEAWDKAKAEVKELGFEKAVDLQNSVKKDQAELEKVCNELETMLAEFMEVQR